MLELNDENFKQEVLESESLVLVDFWAPTCPPCLFMGPIVEEIAKEFEGKVKVGKLDVSENQETPERYGIRGIPTFVIFKNGQATETIVGARPKQDLVERLNSFETIM